MSITLPDRVRPRTRSTNPERQERRARAVHLADQYGGVLSRSQLQTLGYSDERVRAELRAERWRSHGRQTIAVRTGELSDEARRWRAIWEVGPRIAVLDGLSALQLFGVQGLSDRDVHVSVPHTCAVAPVAGVVIHKVRRRHPADLISVGMPRSWPAAAAVRAAHWAVSDRQAALMLVLPVQQRLITGRQLVEATARVRGRTRRRLIALLARDIADGAQSLGELDMAALCRAYGLPAPSRQSVRRLRDGTAYLDVAWDEHRLVLEIDGAGHARGLAYGNDSLRQNELTLGSERVLRIDLIGLRLHERELMSQLARGLGVPGRAGE